MMLVGVFALFGLLLPFKISNEFFLSLILLILFFILADNLLYSLKGTWVSSNFLPKDAYFQHRLFRFVTVVAVGIILFEHASLGREIVYFHGARDLKSSSFSIQAVDKIGIQETHSAASKVKVLFYCAINRIKAYMKRKIECGSRSDEVKRLLYSLVLGERNSIPYNLRDAYRFIGIAHFLALSGLHLGIIFLPLSKLLSRIIRSIPLRNGLLLVILFVYIAVAGFKPSLIRAYFLVSIYLLKRIAGAHCSLLRCLLISGLAIMILNVKVIFDAGFELSFAAVFAIAVLGLPLIKAIEKHLSSGSIGERLVLYIVSSIVLTLSIQFITMPIVLSLFKRSAFLSPAANLVFVLPLTFFLYIGVALSILPLGPTSVLLGELLKPLSFILWHLTLKFSTIPNPAILKGNINIWIYSLSIPFAVTAVKSGARRALLILITCILVVASFIEPIVMGNGEPFVVLSKRGNRADSGRNAYRVIVREGTSGQDRMKPSDEEHKIAGECLLFKGGKKVLFLSGGMNGYEARRITTFLWDNGISSLDAFVIKSGDNFGFRGFAYLLSRVHVKRVVCSPYFLLGSEKIRALLVSRGVEIIASKRGDDLKFASLSLKVTGPGFPPHRGIISRNESSLRVLGTLSDGKRTFILQM